MRRFFSILLFTILLPVDIHAQGNFREEYEKFKNQSVTTYTHFREECNKAFIEFLKDSWTHYQAGSPLEKPKEEEVPPVVIEKDKKEPVSPVRSVPMPFDEIIAPPKDEPRPMPLEPIRPLPSLHEDWVEFNLYNTSFKVRAPKEEKFQLKSVSGREISKAWEKLSAKDYDQVLADCLQLRERYKLCDWAYLQALLAFSKAFLRSQNEAILLTAYLYSQSGYQMRLGTVDKQELTMLFGSRHQIYGYPCYRIDGIGFYPINGNGKDLDIANFAFPKEQGLSLIVNQEPTLTRDASDLRQLKAESGVQSACSVNRNLLAFYENYPSSQWDNNVVTRWAMYANVPLDPVTKEQLYPSLQEAIAGKSQSEAVGILLDFVQTAFEYEYDNKVWGHDRAFFSEESLYYPYCDCEDRSILFSRLVRDMVGLDVILIYYPGHLASAVRFDEEVSGDYITLNNRKFIVCDPTYIGASIGMSMPHMDNKTAKVILLKR